MTPPPPGTTSWRVLVRRHRRGTDEVLAVDGAVRPGESLLGAVRHGLAGLGVDARDVWALDLSGTPARLAVDVPDRQEVDGASYTWTAEPHTPPAFTLGFRPLTRADLPDVVAWQAQPYVARWWVDEARDVAAAEAHYGPALDGEDPTRLWVAEVNGRSVGMLQDYRIGDHPDYALLTARPDAIGVDYLVGDPSWVGRGVGTRLLWTWIRDVVLPGYPAATEVFAAPDHRNTVSLRVLDKLGFTRGLWFDEPQDDGRVDTVVGCTLDVPRVLGGPGESLVTER